MALVSEGYSAVGPECMLNTSQRELMLHGKLVGLSPREAWGYIPASFTAFFFFPPQFPPGSSDSGLIKCMVNSLL